MDHSCLYKVIIMQSESVAKMFIWWYLASVPACSIFLGCSTQWIASHVLYGVSSCSCEETICCAVAIIQGQCFIATGAQRCHKVEFLQHCSHLENILRECILHFLDGEVSGT